MDTNIIRIEIKSAEDRLTIVRILAANGYTVRIVSGTKQGSKSKTTYVEAWKGLTKYEN